MSWSLRIRRGIDNNISRYSRATRKLNSPRWRSTFCTAHFVTTSMLFGLRAFGAGALVDC